MGKEKGELPLLNGNCLPEEGRGKRKEQRHNSGNVILKEEIRKTHYNINNVYLVLNKGKSSSTPGFVEKEVELSPATSPKKSFK